MGIQVVWQNESGAPLARCEANYDERLGRAVPPERSHCLQYIGPADDATFNQAQLPRLVRELEEVASGLAHLPETRQRQFRTVLEFVRGCVGVHTYVRFVGD